MKSSEITQVVKALTGDVYPVGESTEDQIRFDNLETLIEVIQYLVSDIETAAEDRSRKEASMKKIGERAYKFLNELTALDI